MRTFLTTALFLGLWLIPSSLLAQGLDAQQRAQELAAFFNKSKHAIKERHGVRVEKFKEIRSEPVIKKNARAYSGTYEADSGYTFRITVLSDGRVEASGSEPDMRQEARSFTLHDAKIEGALLTGIKLFADGTSEKFEGVFINETERDSLTDNGFTTFGLGVVYDPPRTNPEAGFVITRLFYHLKQ